LTAVSAMAQFLARRASSDPTSFDGPSLEAIETLAEETERMVRMVETFLDLARIESGRLVVEREPVDLVELVGAEAELTRRIAPQVELQVDTPLAFPALTDEVRLRQVLRNLLDNAAKHAGPNPRVQLRLLLGEGEARIEVSDDGPGIPAEALPHIFDRLYRASNVQSQGLGAGLFITREIVERLGGTISVTSAPEAGATFTVRLPLSPNLE
jgi:signal transduction histidine kinase